MIDVESCVRICSCCSGRKDVDDPVDRPLSPGRVQGAEDHVPRLGRRDGRRDRLQVAHFSHENHVGIHTQGPAKRFREARDVHADFPLIDHRFLVRVVILDRIFDRDDVVIVVVVKPVDHAGQTRRLATPRRTRHQEQTSGPRDDILDHQGQSELLEREELAWDLPQHQTDVPALLENGDAKPRLVAEGKAEVGPAHLLQFLLVALRRDALHQRSRVLRTEDFRLQPHQAAMPADTGWLPRRQVQIAGPLLNDGFQKLVDL